MIIVKSYPDNILDLEIPTDVTNDSNEIISNMWIDVSEALPDTSIEITYNGETITLLIEEECKNTPYDIFFLNKEGQYQSFTFFKKRTDKIKVTKEKYSSNDTRKQKIFNTNGQEQFTINSGYIDESHNEIFKQMLLSNEVFLFKDDAFIPITITSSELEFKTRQNDKLISYSINFEYSFNTIK